MLPVSPKTAAVPNSISRRDASSSPPYRSGSTSPLPSSSRLRAIASGAGANHSGEGRVGGAGGGNNDLGTTVAEFESLKMERDQEKAEAKTAKTKVLMNLMAENEALMAENKMLKAKNNSLKTTADELYERVSHLERILFTYVAKLEASSLSNKPSNVTTTTTTPTQQPMPIKDEAKVDTNTIVATGNSASNSLSNADN